MSRERELYEQGFAALDAAAAEGRVCAAASEARVARLKYAAELERAGRLEEAQAIYAAVGAEQEAAR